MLDMSFASAAVIQDAAARKRNDVAGAAKAFHLLAETRIAVVGGVGMSPPDTGGHAFGVKMRRYQIVRGAIVEHHIVSVRQVVGRRVAAVIDRVSLYAGGDKGSHDAREIHRLVIRCFKAVSSDSNVVRV